MRDCTRRLWPISTGSPISCAGTPVTSVPTSESDKTPGKGVRNTLLACRDGSVILLLAASLWPPQARSRLSSHFFPRLASRGKRMAPSYRRERLATAVHVRLRSRGYRTRRSRRLAAQPGRAPNARSPRTIASSATLLTSVAGPLSLSCRHGQRNVNASSTRPPPLRTTRSGDMPQRYLRRQWQRLLRARL